MSEISCRITNTFLQYVKSTRPELMTSLLAGIPYSEEFLLNTDNWISWDVERLLEERLVELFDDELIMFRIGKTIIKHKSLGTVNILLNLFVNPESLLRYAPKIARYFTKDVVQINVIETTSDSATLELKVTGKQTRGACLYNQGMFSSIPELFGLDSAELSEMQCVVPVNEIGRRNGNFYLIDNKQRVHRVTSSNNMSRPIGHAAEDGTFRLNETIFGTGSCIYRLKWNNKIRKFARKKTAGKKKALNEALLHLEENYEKLQQAYERAWKSDERYRNLMKTANDIICFLDPEGVITSVNDKGIELSEYALEEIVGAHFMSFVEDESKQEAMKRFQRSIEGYPDVFELVIRTKSSSRLILSVNSSPIGERGKIVGFMVIARDITREREVAARLLDAERFAAKGIIAAEIAHEINNSLANIETGLYIMDNLRMDNRQKREILKDIREEIGRMSSIVTGILDVYHPNDAMIESVNVNAEVSKVIAITSRRVHGEGIAIVSKLSPELPAVPCNPGHIKQILLNLIKNSEEALASSKKKMIMISTHKENGAVKITVEDTGCGMPVEAVANPNITSTRFTSKKKGSGFGLSICSEIARKYGGNIAIQSEAGNGTCVSLILPSNRNV
jgi:PAS domain S-box-containing protein